jgi:hypothetical protein
MQEYKKSPRCKICRSNLVKEIDIHLENKKPYSKIADWANEIEPDLKLTKKNVWNHNNIHRLEGIKGNGLKKGREKGLKNETPIKIKKKIIKVVKKKKEPEKKEENKKDENKQDLGNAKRYLDELILKAHERLENGISIPTITEAVKAIELRIKIDKGNPIEDALLSFIESVVDNGLPN